MADQMVFSPFRLPLIIEQVEDGTFLATSTALEGFLVQAETIEEVVSISPGVAKALLEAMQEKGIPTGTLRAILRQLGISPDDFYERR